MKLLILGKSGQVASALVQRCQNLGLSYNALARKDLDVTDSGKIAAIFKQQHDYDFVINATAYTAVDKAETESDVAEAVNHLAVKNIAMQCKVYDIPLIHISTDYVFDGSKKTNYAEEDEVSPLGVYGASKLRGEEALQETWHKHIILRVSWIFGAQGNNFVKTMAKLSMTKPELGVVADQYGSPTSAEDITRVIIEICGKIKQSHAEKWGVYHYSGFPVTNWHQLALAAIAEAKKQEMPVMVQKVNAIRTEDYPTPTRRPYNSAFDVSKIKRAFGINQSAWQNDLPAVIANLKSEL